MDIMHVFAVLLALGGLLVILGIGMAVGFLGKAVIDWHAIILGVGIVLTVISVVGAVIKATLDMR